MRAATDTAALLASGTGSGRGAPEEPETGVDFFDVLKRQDVLVHLPYESFNTSLDAFIRQAADDPDVLAIKLTMYRTSERTRLVDSLIRAAERGKQVVVVVELKAPSTSTPTSNGPGYLSVPACTSPTAWSG